MQLLSLVRRHVFSVFLLCRLLADIIGGIATTTLVQDKICLGQFNQSGPFCVNIQNQSSPADNQKAGQVYATATRFATLQNGIELIPTFVASWLVGPFLATYPNATFVLFLVNCSGALGVLLAKMANVYFYHSDYHFMLLSSVFVWLSGGPMTFWPTIYHYVTKSSTTEQRSFRFAVLDVSVNYAYSIGTLVSGQLLVNYSADHHSVQLRSYLTNYYVSLGFYIAALVLLAIMYRVNAFPEHSSKPCTATTTTPSTEPPPTNAITGALFNTDNVRQTFRTFFRRRSPAHVRTAMWIVVAMIVQQSVVFAGDQVTLFGFTERQYHWSAHQFTTWNAVNMIASVTIFSGSCYVLVHRLAVADDTLLVVGLWSTALNYVSIGSLTGPEGFFVSIPAGALWNYCGICGRSALSKMVSPAETSQVFAVMGLFMATAPFVGSLIYAALWTWVTSGEADGPLYPGMIYHFSAALVAVSMWLNLVRARHQSGTNAVVVVEGAQQQTNEEHGHQTIGTSRGMQSDTVDRPVGH